MSMSDPIADMLTRIRNGSQANKVSVSMPASKSKAAIVAVLHEKGFIGEYKERGQGAHKSLEVQLKYFEGSPVVKEIQRISTPGCRIYVRSDNLPSVRNGLGIAILSTSKGLMTDKAALKQRVGGEVICTVF